MMAEEPNFSGPSTQYCAQCGEALEPGSRFCSKCGAGTNQPPPLVNTAPQGQSYPQQVPNYLVQAILVTIFCCLPLGIVSIVFAAQVNGKLASGDLAGAVNTSKNAKTFVWISFGLGLAVVLIWFFFAAIGAALSGF
jgi:hypothetical protein